jgi:hypothetical protein
MRKLLKETSIYASIIGTAIAMSDYQEKRKVLSNFKEEMTNKVTSLTNDLITEQINNVAFKTKIETKLLELQNSTNKAGNIISDLIQEKNINSESFSALKSKAHEEYSKITNIIDDITKSVNDNSNNFISEDFGKYISAFQDYLATLTLEQTFCLIHLLAIFSIFICLFNLATVFYADSLIKYYNLEIKLPKLAKFIRIRSKFQQYYFGWNLFLIVTILASLFYFNLNVFLT